MRHTRLALFGAALIAAAPLAALAQPGPNAAPGPRGAGAMFDRVDANRDGRVTWEESWSFVQARFGEADRDGNGGLSEPEMQAAMRAMWQTRHGGPRADGTAAPATPPAGEAGRGGPDRAAMHAGMMGAMFRALDADRNGQVTLVEIRPAVEARFRALDANADNVVERAELPQRRHGQGRGGHGAGHAHGQGHSHGQGTPGAAPTTPR